MYSAFFNHLPGPGWLRFLIMVILAACLVFFLMEVVFPMVSVYLENTNSTVG